MTRLDGSPTIRLRCQRSSRYCAWEHEELVDGQERATLLWKLRVLDITLSASKCSSGTIRREVPFSRKTQHSPAVRQPIASGVEQCDASAPSFSARDAPTQHCPAFGSRCSRPVTRNCFASRIFNRDIILHDHTIVILARRSSDRWSRSEWEVNRTLCALCKQLRDDVGALPLRTVLLERL
jgi:hypothetical protein